MSKKPDFPKEMLSVELKWNVFNVDDEEVQKIVNLTFVNARIKELALTLSVTTIESSIPDIMEPLTQFRSTVPIKCSQNCSNGKLFLWRKSNF